MKRLLLLPLLAVALQAQCVMCYRTAHAQNAAPARIKFYPFREVLSTDFARVMRAPRISCMS